MVQLQSHRIPHPPPSAPSRVFTRLFCAPKKSAAKRRIRRKSITRLKQKCASCTRRVRAGEQNQTFSADHADERGSSQRVPSIRAIRGKVWGLGWGLDLGGWGIAGIAGWSANLPIPPSRWRLSPDRRPSFFRLLRLFAAIPSSNSLPFVHSRTHLRLPLPADFFSCLSWFLLLLFHPVFRVFVTRFRMRRLPAGRGSWPSLRHSSAAQPRPVRPSPPDAPQSRCRPPDPYSIYGYIKGAPRDAPSERNPLHPTPPASLPPDWIRRNFHVFDFMIHERTRVGFSSAGLPASSGLPGAHRGTLPRAPTRLTSFIPNIFQPFCHSVQKQSARTPFSPRQTAASSQPFESGPGMTPVGSIFAPLRPRCIGETGIRGTVGHIKSAPPGLHSPTPTKKSKHRSP